MPTPMFAIRLAEETQKSLVEMARVYGSPSASAYAREVLEVMTSSDQERVKAFIARWIAKSGEQMTLKFNAVIDDMSHSKRKAAPKGKGKRKGRVRK